MSPTTLDNRFVVMARRIWPWFAGSAATFVGYVGTGWLGVLLLRRLIDPTVAGLSPGIAVPWLPVGIGVAGVLRYGWAAWPAILLGSIAVWGGVQGDPWQAVLPDAVGETLSIVVIVKLLRSWGFRQTLDRYQDSLLLLGALGVGRLIAVGIDAVDGVIMALLLSDPGTGGRAMLQAIGIEQSGGALVINVRLLSFIGHWWANSVAGGVLIVPLLALSTTTSAIRRRWRLGVPVLAALLLIWILCGLGVSIAGWRLALLGAALLLVAVAATSLGVGVAAAATLILTMASASGFAFKLGVFSGLSPSAQLEVAWGFLALLTGTGLVLTAVLAQRERGQREITASIERYRQLFAGNSFPMWAENPADGRIQVVNPAALATYGYSEARFLTLRSDELRVRDGRSPSSATAAGAPFTTIERHRSASGTEFDVEVTRVRIEFEDGALLACFAEPLSERIELRLAALTAGDVERFRLGGDLRHRLNPILVRVSQSAESFATRVARGEPPDSQLLATITTNVTAASALCRQLTRGASPLQEAGGDLGEALRRLPASFADDGPSIRTTIHSPFPINLSIERRDHVYRLAEDAVRAAVARPGVREVRVDFDVSQARVRLAVEDDGAPAAAANASAALGLRSIASRAVAAQGTVQMGPSSTGGSAVVFECAQQSAGATDAPPTVGITLPWTSSVAAMLGRAGDQLSMARPSPNALLDAAVLVAAYVVTGGIGFWLIERSDSFHASFNPGLALPWIANGIGVAGLLLRGERLWPAVFLGSVGVWRGLAHDPWITVLFDAGGETVAALLTVRLLRHFQFRLACDRLRDIVLLAAAAAAGRTIVFFSDAIGVNVAAFLTPQAMTNEMRLAFAPAASLFGITQSALEAGGRWWLNGVAGVLLTVPAVAPWTWRFATALQGRMPELSAWCVALAAAALAIVIVPLTGWRLPTLGFGLVIMTWAAVRFGVPVAAVATLVLSLAATAGFIFRVGPVAPLGPGEGIEVLWGYIALLAITSLFLATTLAEHNQVADNLERLNRRYRALFDAIPHPVFAYLVGDGRIRFANRAAQLRYGYDADEIGRLTVADLDRDARVPLVPASLEPAHTFARHHARSGDEFDVELTVTSVDIDGAPGALCFAIDVSERNRLRTRMLEATDRERRHLARDLHDGLGQVLTGLQLGVTALKRAVERGEPVAAKNVAFVADAARQAELTADRVLRGISPLEDTHGDLIAALRGLAEHLPPALRHQLKVTVTESAPVSLPLELREHLFQIVRECVTNALKHARASAIEVSLSVSPGEIEARIEDDGVGLDRATPSAGIGLESLRLRAGALRGDLEVSDRPGRGTIVRCRCPQPRTSG